MADFPYLPLFTDAIMADCGHLSDAEFGLYMRILMTMWRTPSCRIPASAEWLEKRFKLPIVQIGVILAEFCICDGNFWTQKRLVNEKDFVNKNSKRQSVRAKSRWEKDKPDAVAMQEMHRSGNAPTPTPILLKEERREDVFSEIKPEGKTPLTPAPTPKPTAAPKPETPDTDNPEWFCGRIIKLRKKQFHALMNLSCFDHDGFFKYLNEKESWLERQPAHEQVDVFNRIRKDLKKRYPYTGG